MSVWHPNGSKPITLVADLAAMASSVDQEISDVVSVRQAHSYIWSGATGRTSQLGMTEGSTGVQLDTGGEWKYLGGQWRLVNGTLPTFIVKGSSTQSIVSDGSTSYDTLNSLWATPEVNNGFSSWASGVLTIQQEGVYFLNAAIVYDANGTGYRYMAIAKGTFVTAPSNDFYQRTAAVPIVGGDTLVTLSTFAVLNVGDTVKVAAWQTSGGALSTDPSTPSQNQLNVRYMGPKP